MKTNIYHLIILDESGSMDIIKDAAISGCNETIQNIHSLQKKYATSQKHFISLVTFNSNNPTKIIFDKMPIEEINDFDKNSYEPDCCTPLYDSMGLSFTHLQNTLNKKVKYSVLATIITDGLENSSKIFDSKKTSSLIDELGKNGWTFAYIGANQDVIQESKKLNIHNAMEFSCNKEGTSRMFSALTNAQNKFCETTNNEESCFDSIFEN